MRSLEALGARSLAHRKGRSLLTATGIVLGVAILFGVLVTNASIDAAFSRLLKGFGGDFEVVGRPVGAYDATFPAVVADRVAALDDVEAVSPSLGVAASVVRPEREAAPIHLVGIDLDRWKRLTHARHRLSEGRFYRPGADEVVVRAASPPEWGRARIGDRLSVSTPAGPRTMTVVGRFAPDPRDGESTEPRNDVHTSMATARSARGVGEVVDAFIVGLADDVDVDVWIERHRGSVGPGVELQRGALGDDGFRPLLTTIQGSLTFIATIALFLGAFLIYLTLSMAVVERTRTYGTLRALGATRAQVRRVVLTEAAALGVVSTLLGLVLGVAISTFLLRAVSALVRVQDTHLVVPPVAILVAILAGVGTTLAASLVPARHASRLPAVEAMKGDVARDTRLSRGWIVGAVVLAVGVLVPLVVRGITGLAVGTLGILFGAVLLVPPVVQPLARALGALTRRGARGVGPVAVMHLVKERSRSAYTLALVMVVLAMALTIGGANISMRRAVDHVVDANLGSDMRIWTSGGFGPGLERAVAGVPGVAAVSAVRFGRTSILSGADRESTEVVVVDPSTYFDVSGFVWSDGSDQAATKALARVDGVLVAEAVALRLGLRRGGPLRLETRAGPKEFRVAGIYTGFGGDQPVVVGRQSGRDDFGADRAGVLMLEVTRGSDVHAVRRALLAGPGRQAKLFVQTADESTRQARNQVDGFFGVFYAILLVAAVVGVLGLANTLAMSVLQRTREIGVLRAVGTRRRQIRGMVLVEASTLILVAVLLAVPLGSLLSVLFVRTSATVIGSRVDYVYPWAWVAVIGVLAGVIGALAAVLPARRASRLPVVSALSFD